METSSASRLGSSLTPLQGEQPVARDMRAEFPVLKQVKNVRLLISVASLDVPVSKIGCSRDTSVSVFSQRMIHESALYLLGHKPL